ncbi:unnamed protein product [Calypogeia fissa]
MSLGTKIWSGGTLVSLPLSGKQCETLSTRRGIHHNIQALTGTVTSKVRSGNSPKLQLPVFCLRASRGLYRNDTLAWSPVYFSARIATLLVRCLEHSETNSAADGDDGGGIKKPYPRTRGLFTVAALIGSATVLSKLLGLVREIVLAAVFGVGPIINAFNYSSIIPGFFLTLVGGINGPFHTAVATSLSKRLRGEGRTLVQRLSIITGMVFGAISMAIFFFSAHLIDVLAPGLLIPGYKEGLLTRKLAIIQLKIMAPCTMLAALIGIGFGTLSSAGVYGIPSLSPALSSISVLVAVSIYVLTPQQIRPASQDAISAAAHLAAGATVGAMAQWVLQALAQHRAGFGPLKVSKETFRNPLMDEGFQEVLRVLVPAAVASGMLQIATYTDLYFASFIPGGAAALGYANLLAMAPVGILSSSILVPLIPLFARVSKPSHELELQERVRQGLLVSMALTFLMTALMVPLARPIVRVVFERRAFDAPASGLVSSLLICYVVGSSFYLARDLLVRVFYVLGDGQTPFQISMAAIFMNALLDWLFVQYAGFGVQGLVVATSLVNCGSALWLIVKLSRKYHVLQLQHWVRPLLQLGCSATLAGITTKYSYYIFSVQFFSSAVAFNTRWLWAADLISILLASLSGAIAYFIPLLLFQSTETKAVISLLRTNT